MSSRSWWSTFLLALILGYLGGHRFYAGKIGTGILWLFTGGLFGIGFIVDIIMICTQTFTDGSGRIIRIN